MRSMGSLSSASIGTIIVLSMAFLGVIYPVLTATTVVETVTETVAEPGRTLATVTVVGGGEVVIRIEMPKVKMVVNYERQDQVCVVRFSAQTPPGPGGVIAVPGTTVAVPGTTATFVLNAPTEVVRTESLRTAFTTTGYTVVTVGTTFSVGQYVTTLAMPVSLYGVIEEACRLAYEVNRVRIEPERVPATVVIGYPGFTFAFPGYTLTMPEFTVPPEFANFKTTATETRRGTTESFVTTLEGTTATLRTRVEGSTVTTTVVVPGTTYVRTYTVTRTLTEQVTTVTATGATQTTAPTTAAVTMTPAPGGRAEQLFDPMTLGIFAAIAVAVAVGILFAYRRGRT